MQMAPGDIRLEEVLSLIKFCLYYAIVLLFWY